VWILVWNGLKSSFGVKQLPRLYVTPTELEEHPLGIALASQIASLGIGVIDKLLSKASQKCDSECRKRLQAPGSSTLSHSANVGDVSISVNSTATLDDLDEQAVWINPGAANQETLIITPGGVSVNTPWASPYPGTISLQGGLQFGHAQTEPVQYLYKEVTLAGSSSSSDPYTESIQTQAMQLALAHLPPAHAALTRVIFLKNYPIINIYQIEHAFSFTNEFNVVDNTIETIFHNYGAYRFNVGTVILREGAMRTTYTAGFQTVPEDVKEAAIYFFAEAMRLMTNPSGATSLTLGKKSQSWSRNRDGVPPLVADAKDILKRYKRTK
jgi:hypothetical protein